MGNPFEYFFLEYANIPLSKGASSFHELLGSIKDVYDHLYGGYEGDLGRFVQRIIKFSEYNNSNVAKEKLKVSIKDIKDIAYQSNIYYQSDIEDEQMAFNAVFGYSIGPCISCWIDTIGYGWSQNWYENSVKANSKTLKCYECTQAIFQYLLSEIINGKEYSEVADYGKVYSESADSGLQILFYNVESPFNRRFFIVPNSNRKLPFKETVEQVNWLVYERNEFNSYILQVAGYTLADFLMNNDRRKLKKCPYCKTFFIAKDIRRQRCYSDDCRKAYEKEKKKRQRKKDPVKYY